MFNINKVDIVYKNNNILVVNKPAKMLIHNIRYQKSKKISLTQYIFDLYNQKYDPVNRLDYAVSGLVLFSKNKKITKLLQDNWQTSLIKKKYYALVRGRICAKGIINEPIITKLKGRKTSFTAETHFERKQYFVKEDLSLIELSIITGRKHQIRIHLSRYHYNIIGDTKHGLDSVNLYFNKKYSLNNIFLHSYHLQIKDLLETDIDIKINLPKELSQILSILANK